MNASDKTKRQLLEEIRVLRSRNAKFERLSHEERDVKLKAHTLQASQENKELHNITQSRISEHKIMEKSWDYLSKTNKIIPISIGLAAFFWVIESGIHTFLFNDGGFFDQILPSNPHELRMRLVVCFILIWFSVYVHIIVKQLKRAKVMLQQSHNELEFRVRERTAELTKTNEKLNIEIAERRRVEKVLRESEEKFRALFELSPYSTVLSDLEGNIKACNCQFVKLHATQKGPDAQVGRNVSEFFSKEERQALFSTTEQTVSEKKLQGPVEYTMLREDGTKFRAETNCAIVLDQDGEPQALIATAHDITERKKAQEAIEGALNESQQIQKRISALLGASRTVMNQCDFAQKARSIFDACKDLIGATSGYVALLSKDGAENEVLFLDPGGLNCTVDPNLPMPVRGLRAEAYRKGKAVFDNEFSNNDFVKYLPKGHVHLSNVLFAPLVVEGRTIGLMGLANKPSGFTEEDTRMATAFAEFAAISLHNSRTLQALKEERDRVQKYLDVAGVMFIVIDANGEVTLINNKGCEVLGYKDEDIIGKNWFRNFLPDRIRDDVAQVFNKLMAGEIEPVEYHENLVIAKSGEERIIAWHNIMLRDEMGNITGTLSSGEDITERKKADEALQISREEIQRQNEFLNNVLESLIYPFLVIDAENYKVKIANAAARISMLSEETTCFMLSHKLDRPCDESGCSCPLKDIKKIGHAMTMEHVHQDRNGNSQYVEVHSCPILDDKGDVTDIIEYCIDITKRRRAEKALEENERRFRATFEQAAVGVAHVAPDGRFIRVNQRFCDIAGYTREEMLKRTFQDITYPDDLDADLDYVRQMLADEISTYSMEKRYLRKDGSLVWINLTVSLLREESGEPKFFISVIEDITERKGTEERLRKYQERLRSLALELSLAEERERRHIAAELHDQISQTLALSKINLQTLGKSAGLADNSMFHEVVDSITSTIEQVQHLTFDLSSPTLYKFGLEKAVDELLNDRLRKIGMTYKLTGDKSPKPLDEDIMVLLFQSVRELLINIIKHAQAHKVSVTIQRDGDNIMITVSDDGVGFDADRLKSFGRRKGGFGLFNIRERLDYISGSFKIESQAGKGSQFTLKAPLKVEAD